MAFLDNSGDIILDAVLTDTGRLRLAQGDGSFKISKFALGDDEINYGLYNKTHASGSAYYDLEVLQTPVLEAFTNNTSNLKTKLMSISRTNVMYMPILRRNLNDGNNPAQVASSRTFRRRDPSGTKADIAKDIFYIAADADTYDYLQNFWSADSKASALTLDAGGEFAGVIQGYTATTMSKYLIRIDQGLDTEEIPPTLGLDSDLLETAFIIEMDYRLGRVKPVESDTPTPVNFIDDDNIASYYLTSNVYVNPQKDKTGGIPATAIGPDGTSKKQTDLEATNPQVFAGPRGNTVQFRIQTSQELQTSTYLFTQVGSSETPSNITDNISGFHSTDPRVDDKTTYYIDSTIRVIGANTGYRLDIPVRYIKIQ